MALRTLLVFIQLALLAVPLSGAPVPPLPGLSTSDGSEVVSSVLRISAGIIQPSMDVRLSHALSGNVFLAYLSIPLLYIGS